MGVTVHGPTPAEALDLIETWVKADDGRCRFVVATGFHGLWVAHENPDFLSALNDADLFCPDGIAAVQLARLKGTSLPGRVTGSDILCGMLERSVQNGYSNFFYGDSDDTLQRLANTLPRAAVAGTFSPPFRPLDADEEAGHVATINSSGADILWVGLGCPRQEAWIARNRHRLTVKVAIGVGAAFRFQAGIVKRVPPWLGEVGLEWAWRLMAEPKKMWRRDLIDGPRFLVAAARDVVRSRRDG